MEFMYAKGFQFFVYDEKKMYSLNKHNEKKTSFSETAIPNYKIVYI